MDQFLANAFSFPTLVFTIPLMVIVLFWLLTFLGMLDIEILYFDTDIDADAGDVGDPGQVSFLETLGLDGIPLTVTITLLDLYAWIFTYLARQHVMPYFDGIITGTALGAVFALTAMIIAFPLAAISCRPMRRLFITHEAVSKFDIIGKLCTITTSRVDGQFGQAATIDGTMVLNIRAPEPNNFKKGETVVLLDFDEDTDTYSVVAEEELLGSQKS